MKHLPFPLRVAAGIAVTTAERVRDLPKQLTELPVTVASQVLQASMRVQQQVTELAIKGDDALSALRPAEEEPSWATFDEDIEPDLAAPAGVNGSHPGAAAQAAAPRPLAPEPPAPPEPPAQAEPSALPEPAATKEPAEPLADDSDDPWVAEERALAEEHSEGEFDSPGSPADGSAPGGITGYDELTLPQVRARLRRLTLTQLEELLAYEREHANRPAFTGMLTRRIGNVRQATADEGGSEDQNPR
ncbi:lipid droplet-associated protein [Prauserella muralis]|uniref:DUF8129 domain-containing protein n=1 Tax=Prauserella muralis TaxID=588067 RepID=A0A2V4ALR4_9PSEU|nr:lipid droplet-associated protein [Prauserella muralis]PXY21187.1 hypothetical protein BAY60_27390 [Prauserella muralis]